MIDESMIEELITKIEYKDGFFYWKEKKTGGVYAGDVAGCLTNKGYMWIRYKGGRYQYHRIMFFMHHGYIPERIDHIDGNKLNNDINNLRPATKAQNGWNSKVFKTNKSGSKNVHWNKNERKWVVLVRTPSGKRRFCGGFKDLELADLVAQEARDKYHGEFARHG